MQRLFGDSSYACRRNVCRFIVGRRSANSGDSMGFFCRGHTQTVRAAARGNEAGIVCAAHHSLCNFAGCHDTGQPSVTEQRWGWRGKRGVFLFSHTFNTLLAHFTLIRVEICNARRSCRRVYAPFSMTGSDVCLQARVLHTLLRRFTHGYPHLLGRIFEASKLIFVIVIAEDPKSLKTVFIYLFIFWQSKATDRIKYKLSSEGAQTFSPLLVNEKKKVLFYLS